MVSHYSEKLERFRGRDLVAVQRTAVHRAFSLAKPLDQTFSAGITLELKELSATSTYGEGRTAKRVMVDLKLGS